MSKPDQNVTIYLMNSNYHIDIFVLHLDINTALLGFHM